MAAGTSSRAKGRRDTEIRTLLFERSLLERADGSAKWQQEGASVLAAVHGPRQAPTRAEDPERAVVEVVFKPRAAQMGATERLYEAILKQCLEGVLLASLHPRTQVQVVVQVLSAGGSLLSCALNAAACALLDAGIPMSQMFAAIAVAHLPGGRLVLDPDETEEAAAAAVLTLAFPHHRRLADGGATAGQQAAVQGEQKQQQQQQLVVGPGLLACHTAGRVGLEEYGAALEAGLAGCGVLAEFMHGLLAAKQQQADDGAAAAAGEAGG